MGKATLARQKAIGTIGGGKVRALEEAGLTIMYTEEYDKLAARIAELERRNKQLSDLTLGATERNDLAAQVLKEAMTSKDT